MIAQPCDKSYGFSCSTGLVDDQRDNTAQSHKSRSERSIFDLPVPIIGTAWHACMISALGGPKYAAKAAFAAASLPYRPFDHLYWTSRIRRHSFCSQEGRVIMVSASESIVHVHRHGGVVTEQ